jgi:hypothetical protein
MLNKIGMQNEDQGKTDSFPVFFASVFKISGCVSSQTVVKNHPFLSDVIFHQKNTFQCRRIIFLSIDKCKE